MISRRLGWNKGSLTKPRSALGTDCFAPGAGSGWQTKCCGSAGEREGQGVLEELWEERSIARLSL